MLDASDVVSDGPVPSWDRPVVDMGRDTALTVVVLACGFGSARLVGCGTRFHALGCGGLLDVV